MALASELDYETVQQYVLTLRVSDGAMTDTATATIAVTNVNEAPTVNGITNQSDIEGGTVTPVQVFAFDPEGGALTYTATGLPDGLVINATTGVISGKLTYSASGALNVTVKATDPGGLFGTRSFTWTVENAAIATLTGTEMFGVTVLPNSVTVAGVTTTTLYVSQGNSVHLAVGGPPFGFAPLPADALYSIGGAGASPAAGNFTSWTGPIVSFSGPASTYVVNAGIDLNGDSVLQGAEVTHTFVAELISFVSAVFSSQRVGGGPVEPGLTTIKAGEHLEVGGSFLFALWAPGVGPNSMIRYELWNTWLLDELLASGRGLSFTHALATGDAGNCFVRYYVDANGDGERNWYELYVDSDGFWVQEKKVYNIAVEVSDQIPDAAAFAATIPALYNAAADILLRKDGEPDHRAAVQFNATATIFASTPSGGARPDIIENVADRDAQAAESLAADVVIVSDIRVDPETGNPLPPGYSALGYTTGEDWRRIVLRYTADEVKFAITAAHEFGHGVHLLHSAPDDPLYVMNRHYFTTMLYLTFAEADAYD